MADQALLNTRLFPGQKGTFDVQFRPTAAGAREALLEVASTAGASRAVPLAGSATALVPVIKIGATWDFGDREVGTDVKAQMIVSNVGTGVLKVSDLRIQGRDSAAFAVVSNGCQNLAPGGSASIVVQFRPMATGPKVATLVATHNAAGSAHHVQLSGRGVLVPAVRLDPTSLDFGLQVWDTSATATVKIRNTGSGPLTIRGMRVEGPQSADFAVVSRTPPGNTVAPGAACEVVVRFHPKSRSLSEPRTRRATLVIDDDAPASPHRLPLTGQASADDGTF